jgi:hypothetical protein
MQIPCYEVCGEMDSRPNLSRNWNMGRSYSRSWSEDKDRMLLISQADGVLANQTSAGRLAWQVSPRHFLGGDHSIDKLIERLPPLKTERGVRKTNHGLCLKIA